MQPPSPSHLADPTPEPPEARSMPPPPRACCCLRDPRNSGSISEWVSGSRVMALASRTTRRTGCTPSPDCGVVFPRSTYGMPDEQTTFDTGGGHQSAHHRIVQPSTAGSRPMSASFSSWKSNCPNSATTAPPAPCRRYPSTSYAGPADRTRQNSLSRDHRRPRTPTNRTAAERSQQKADEGSGD